MRRGFGFHTAHAMLILISYDIVNTRRRTRVMQLLKGYGSRVQRSVFECNLDEPTFLALSRTLEALIDTQTDSVRCYRLDASAVQRIVIHGRGQVTRDPTHYLV